MISGAEIATAKLSVALDVRDPFSFLSVGPTTELGKELGIQLNWLPFRGHPFKPPSKPGADDDRGIVHRRHRANMVAREIAIYAEAQQLILQEPYRDVPADAANLAWIWMRSHASDQLEPFIFELFRRYWALELDASNLRSAASVVRFCGVDDENFLAWAMSHGAAALEHSIAELGEAGVSTTPAFLVGDELFQGRQHLPMIRWLLEGRTGPIPI